MKALLTIDWDAVFRPSTSIPEVILRGTLVYLFLFIVLRFLRRSAKINEREIQLHGV